MPCTLQNHEFYIVKPIYIACLITAILTLAAFILCSQFLTYALNVCLETELGE